MHQHEQLKMMSINNLLCTPSTHVALDFSDKLVSRGCCAFRSSNRAATMAIAASGDLTYGGRYPVRESAHEGNRKLRIYATSDW
eukprot:3446275-Amphidinium_carterae.1